MLGISENWVITCQIFVHDLSRVLCVRWGGGVLVVFVAKVRCWGFF